jgi:hypothetical protein
MKSLANALKLTAVALFILALIPNVESQLIVSSLLGWSPFIRLYEPPLVYADKPWILTYSGVIITAGLWAFAIFIFGFLIGKDEAGKRA